MIIRYIDTLLDTSSARARNRMNYYNFERLQIIVAHGGLKKEAGSWEPQRILDQSRETAVVAGI